MRDNSAVVTVAMHKVRQSGGLSFVMRASGRKDLSDVVWAGTLAALLESNGAPSTAGGRCAFPVSLLRSDKCVILNCALVLLLFFMSTAL